jgi:hypothetical protein
MLGRSLPWKHKLSQGLKQSFSLTPYWYLVGTKSSCYPHCFKQDNKVNSTLTAHPCNLPFYQGRLGVMGNDQTCYFFPSLISIIVHPGGLGSLNNIIYTNSIITEQLPCIEHNFNNTSNCTKEKFLHPEQF